LFLFRRHRPDPPPGHPRGQTSRSRKDVADWKLAVEALEKAFLNPSNEKDEQADKEILCR